MNLAFSLDTPVVVNAFLILCALCGTVFNILVIFIFYRRPSLRSPSNRFILNLVVANLLSCVVFAPTTMLLDLVSSGGLSVLVVTSSIFSVVAIAIDRYSAVLNPLHYAMSVTKTRSILLIGGTWLSALFLASPHFFVQCTSPDFWKAHSLTLLTTGFSIPLVALVLIYVKMYSAAHKNSMRTRRHSISATLSGEYDEHRRKMSNSVIFFGEESRAVRTAVLVILSYLVTWSPYYMNVYLSVWEKVTIPAQVSNLCIVLSSILSPIIYVFRNELIRKEVTSILHWKASKHKTKPPPLKHLHSQTSYFDSFSTECHHETPPTSADFISSGDSRKIESVTFKIAPKRCGSCIRQNSDSSNTSSNLPPTPVLGGTCRPKIMRAHSEPTTPKLYAGDEKPALVFKFQNGEGTGLKKDRDRQRLQRLPAVETYDETEDSGPEGTLV
ncbi:hypothetical protein M8J76_013695 [Diaphorina citri]|nr:hypothetical protein M8J76_013695 [Diaphorina citri]